MRSTATALTSEIFHVSERILLGMLTPSSNTTLEPVTTQMIAGIPEVSAHFSRFRVTEIALSDKALGQFDDSEILRAAELLAHAKVDVIGWNGTSSGWLGFEADERLCHRITNATGIPACTSVLALNEILRRTDVRRFGLVTPYRDDVQTAIVKNYAACGFDCVAERHLGLQHNFSFSEVGADDIGRMTREVAKERPQAITIFCTNLRGAPLVEALEAELGIPVYDSIATVVWKSLSLAGADPARIKGWGRLFREVA
jgi:maleate isomerase